MKISKADAWVGASVLAVASQAMGQQAVEWKVSDGGNGHWYQPVALNTTQTFETGQAYCAARGGHLVTITSAAESTFVDQIANQDYLWNGNWVGPIIGLHVDGSVCVAGCWVTGEPVEFTNWHPGNPDVPESDQCVFLFDRAGQSPAGGGRRRWQNYPCSNPPWGYPRSFIIEWSADCNDDGIVDYGQILSGELVDANGNGVPDCCEDGTVCTPSLTVNSGFESGSPLNACASESVSAGNLVASGWQVTAGTVDRIRGGSACATSTQPKFGDYCLDLCGTPASSGAIKQLVPTVPGHKYRCTFWLSGDASAGPSAKKVHAKVGDYIDLSYTFNCSGSGAQAWVMNQFEFTARGANEALAFVADNGVTTGGPMLDSINLVDITTQCVGDLDASGQVDGADIALLLLNFGDCPVGP